MPRPTRAGVRAELLRMTRREWVDLKEETFNALFKKSPVQRTGYVGLKRNIDFLERSRGEAGPD